MGKVYNVIRHAIQDSYETKQIIHFAKAFYKMSNKLKTDFESQLILSWFIYSFTVLNQLQNMYIIVQIKYKNVAVT